MLATEYGDCCCPPGKTSSVSFEKQIWGRRLFQTGSHETIFGRVRSLIAF